MSTAFYAATSQFHARTTYASSPLPAWTLSSHFPSASSTSCWTYNRPGGPQVIHSYSTRAGAKCTRSGVRWAYRTRGSQVHISPTSTSITGRRLRCHLLSSDFLASPLMPVHRTGGSSVPWGVGAGGIQLRGRTAPIRPWALSTSACLRKTYHSMSIRGALKLFCIIESA